MFGNGRYANVTATLALVIALSGTSYAAITVSSKNIRDGSVRGVDVANNTLTSGKIRNGSLLARDFRTGQLPAGAAGPQGPPGTSAIATIVLRDAFTALIPAGEVASVTVPCAANEKAQSGGLYSSSSIFSMLVSAPVTSAEAPTNPTGWRVDARNIAGAPNALYAYAICAGP